MDTIKGHLSKSNVLIIDDCSSSLNSLTKIIEQKGYSVRAIFNGEMALHSIRKNPPDIILLKGDMANIDGYTICNTLTSEEKLNKIPKILIITSNKCLNKDRVYDCGAVDYIPMPFNNKEVLARVETHLKLPFIQQGFDALENSRLERAEELEEITTEIKEFNVLLGEEITQRTKTEEALKESEKQLRCSLELQKKSEDERKRLDEIEEYDRIRTEFFSNISHELRTPINVIFFRTADTRT